MCNFYGLYALIVWLIQNKRYLNKENNLLVYLSLSIKNKGDINQITEAIEDSFALAFNFNRLIKINLEVIIIHL